MDYLRTNRESWDKRTEVHVNSEFYDVEGFLNGANTLKNIEISEMGIVDGKTLLHLQCHFGLDTLSWARKGAIVTGVDLSPTAIKKANEIKMKANLKGDFICSDVYTFGENSKPKYDIIFTSYGAICWLPSLKKWAETIVSCLKPGGVFYMAEFHPVNDIVSGYSYFHSPEPCIEEEGTYTENCNGEKSTLITWAHPLGEVINALIKSGIRIDSLNEYPYSPYNCFEGMIEREKGKFYISKFGNNIPLIFTIRGKKVT